MKHFAIVYIALGEHGDIGKIGTVYQAEEPEYGTRFSGDYIRPETTKHVEVPEGFSHDLRILKATIDGTEVTLSEDIEAKNSIALQAQKEIVEGLVIKARTFGDKLIRDFTVENVMLGITADGKTEEILDKTSRINLACMSGSLHVARSLCLEFPADQKDPKYLNNERLLVFVNKIEQYLNLPITPEMP